MTITAAKQATKTELATTDTKAQQSALRRLLRKVAITTLGTLTILAGIVMLVIPGPGMLTILGGISILGTEYPWAKRLTGFIVIQAKRLWAWIRIKVLQKDRHLG